MSPPGSGDTNTPPSRIAHALLCGFVLLSAADITSCAGASGPSGTTKVKRDLSRDTDFFPWMEFSPVIRHPTPRKGAP